MTAQISTILARKSVNADLPLCGVRTIELCWVWSGPLLGHMLADLGAEVIKVEWYKRFDVYRTCGVERLAGQIPESVRRKMSQSFHGLDRNKSGVTLDLKAPEPRDALLDLAASSQMVIENLTAGTLDRLGIGYDALCAANRGIVLLSLAGFGSASRLVDMRAYGLALSLLSRLEVGVVDARDGSFLGSPTFVSSDPNAASYGLLCATAALLDARRTGDSGHVELSQLEAAGHVGAEDDDALIQLAGVLGLDPTLPATRTEFVPTGEAQHFCVDWQGILDRDGF